MHSYYATVFRGGKKNAAKQYFQTKILLKSNPFLGHPVEDMDGIREITISKMPFAFVYRVNGDTIEVLRVWDQRRDRTGLKL